MSTRTKSVPVFERDNSVLTMVAGLERRDRCDVIHAALEEYVAGHRSELLAGFVRARRAAAEADRDALARTAAAALSRLFDTLADEAPA